MSSSLSSGTAPRVAPAGTASLTERIQGSVLLPGQGGYREEKAVYNTALEHRPALVVAAASAQDVRTAVAFAAEHGMDVAVQATGHGAAAPAIDTLMISTRRMRGVEIDPDRRTALVQAGALWQDVIDAAAPHGLAPLNGSSPGVGVVGYTLGGGLGLMSRTHGYAADHVLSIDLVTASGEETTATPDRHPDLFWALRGGKGNFGVVTAMEFGLFPVPNVYAGALILPGRSASEVMLAWRAWTADCPEEMTSSLALLRLPDAPPIPEPLRGRLSVALRFVHLGSPQQGERLVAPFRAMEPIVDTVREMSYTDIASVYSDPVAPTPYRQRCIMLDDLGDDGVRAMVELAGPDSDCTDMIVELRHLGGALSRPPRVPSAVGRRDAAFTLTTLSEVPAGAGPGADPGEGALLERMRVHYAGRRFINFLSGPDASDLTREAFDADTYSRLVRVKSHYDPNNIFRANHNIAPEPDHV
ncbi:FAD-binding oxidoreductase [Nocardiopsis sp. NPDC006832]|uniref:FAD-binding oxidoreductase n=1 Tax=Nocardiopsis sp. NPDC006832 TaxID=3157188 RepID=UPI0033EFCFEE